MSCSQPRQPQPWQRNGTRSVKWRRKRSNAPRAREWCSLGCPQRGQIAITALNSSRTPASCRPSWAQYVQQSQPRAERALAAPLRFENLDTSGEEIGQPDHAEERAVAPGDDGEPREAGFGHAEHDETQRFVVECDDR